MSFCTSSIEQENSMNTFFSQDFFMIVGIAALLFFMLLLVIVIWSSTSDKKGEGGQTKQTEKTQVDERKEWGKINTTLKTAFSPELEIEADELISYFAFNQLTGQGSSLYRSTPGSS